MRTYTADDIATWMHGHEHLASHVIVAHTHHRSCIAHSAKTKYQNLNTERYLSGKLEETSKSIRYALNCFNASLYPENRNLPRRKPSIFKPFTFVTIEGAKFTADAAQTIHANIALGNLPKHLTLAQIKALFFDAWCIKAKQKGDITVTEYYRHSDKRSWFGYSLKEAEENTDRAWNTNSVWDVQNCWIPNDPL